MNPTTNKKIYPILGGLIVILAIVFAISYSRKGSAPAGTPSASVSDQATTTASSSPAVSVYQPTFAYSAVSDKKSYTQNEPITVIIAALNLTDEPQSMYFKDGCQGTFTINGFDMLAHMRCLPDATFFTIPPHEIQRVSVVNYPSVNKLAPGTYTIHASIVGYGGADVKVTVTK
jgi:hypothetical protein